MLLEIVNVLFVILSKMVLKLCVLFLAIIWDWNILLTVREITSMQNVKNE